MTRFEPRHELALETAIGVMVAQRDVGRQGLDATIFNLRDLLQTVIADQVLSQAVEQEALGSRAALRMVEPS